MVSFKHLFLAALASGALAQNATLRFMPFGDSITEIICWRALLWEKLQATEWKSVDFVGSGKTENNCGDTKYDRDNEGHSGFLAIDIANKNQLDGWLNKNPADVMTMHLGTNDIVQQNKAVTDIIAAFTKLVGTMRTKNPKVKIIVRPLLPRPIDTLRLPRRTGRTNHSPGHRQLQHQDPTAQRRDPHVGSGPQQDGIAHLDRRPVHWIRIDGFARWSAPEC
jgi:hypothetical protein